MALTRPAPGQPLSNPSGPVVLDEYADAIEQNELDILNAEAAIAANAAAISGIVASGSPSVVYSDAFSEIPAALLHSADAVTDGTATWTVVGGQGGAVAVLDTTTHAPSSCISGDLNYAAGSGTSGKLYCDLVTPVSVGFHTDFDMDIRWTLGSGSGSDSAFEVVVASGAALTGTVIVKNISVAVPSENTWTTATLHLAGTALTSIKSFGVRKKSTSSGGATTKHVIFKLDKPELSATTSIDVGLATASRALVVAPTYTTALAQGLVALGSTQSLLDLRPSQTNLSRFRGVKSLRDWQIDETGATDVTAALNTIFASLLPGDLLTSPPTAVYRMDRRVQIDKSDITIDMQGARIFASNYTGDKMFQVTGSNVTLWNWRIFGRAANFTSNGSLLVTVAGTPSTGGTTRTLSTQGDEVRGYAPLGANIFEEQFSRDEHGYIQFDLSMSGAIVANDITASVTNHDGTIVFYTTTFGLSSTAQTTYPIKFLPNDTFSRMVLHIKKNSTGNTLTVHNVKSYRPMRYASAAIDGGDSTANHAIVVTGPGCTIENYWAEGMGGDGLNIAAIDEWTIRVRNYFARGMGREGVVVTKGGDILIEDFVLGPCAREPIDIEPETGTDKLIRNLRFRNGVIQSGQNAGVINVSDGPGRTDHLSFEDIWLRSYQGGPMDLEFWEAGVVRRLTYTWEGTGLAPDISFAGTGGLLEDIVSDGSILITGDNYTLRRSRINDVDQTGSLIVTGTGCHVQDIQIGDPDVVVTIDTALTFNPVQLAADTTYDNIRCSLWKTEFGNTYKSAIANGQPWWPRGLDMNGGGIRELRGLSASTTPANNLCGSAAVTTGASSVVVAFPPKTDVTNPRNNFNLTASGPHQTKLFTDAVGSGGTAPTGTWTVTYNGSTSAPISVNASPATVQGVLNGLPTMPVGGVVVTGSSAGIGNLNLILTWAPTLGDLPSTLFTATSIDVKTWKGNAKPVLISTQVIGGFVVPNKQYWYRVAGRTFEGQPLAALAVKKIILGAANNSITVSSVAPVYYQDTDLKLAGITVWRAGPFTIDGASTYTGDYTKRVDAPGSRDFSHPTGITDRETAASGIPWVDGVYTTAEVSTNQSGWEPDTNYAVACMPSWLTETAITTKTRGGFTASFGTVAPAGATIDWVLARKP